jgi:Glycosyltransferase
MFIGMKVLYIIGGAAKVLGSERVAIEIIKGLQGNGVEFVVITANKGPVNEVCNSLSVENHIVPFDFYVYKKANGKILNSLKQRVKCAKINHIDTKAMNTIESIVDISNIDLIHSNISRTLVGGRLSKKYGLPHVWGLQELRNGHYGLSLLKPHQIDWMNNHGTKFIAVSDAVQSNWIQGGLDKNKIIRIYNGIDADKYKGNMYMRAESHKGVSSRIRLVMMGSLCEAKGQHLLLEALHQIKNAENLFTVDFYGVGYGGEDDVYTRKLETMSEKYGLKTSFHGYVDNAFSELYKYDVGVVCSKGEAFGLSTLEYMCSGVNVIVSDTGANRELISSEQFGMIYHRDDIKDLAHCLELLIEQPYKTVESRKSLMEYAGSRFSLKKQLNSIIEVYEGLVNHQDN